MESMPQLKPFCCDKGILNMLARLTGQAWIYMA